MRKPPFAVRLVVYFIIALGCLWVASLVHQEGMKHKFDQAYGRIVAPRITTVIGLCNQDVFGAAAASFQIPFRSSQ